MTKTRVDIIKERIMNYKMLISKYIDEINGYLNKIS